MSTFKVLIVDDHTMFREGVKSLLEKQADMEVVGEAANGQATLEKVKNLRPDMVLLDISMPGRSGLDVISQIKKIDSRIKVLMLSMYENEEYLCRALKAGASGYVIKRAAADDLVASIKAARAGEVYLSPSMSTQLVNKYLMLGSNETEDDTTALPYDALTDREREILRLLALGKDNKNIARLLDIAYRTVETHRANIMKKLNLHTLAHLVAFAIRSGIINPDELLSSPE
jgi:two-component system response regulator NreC